MDCLFCKIASGAIPVKAVYEDELVLAFPDINPQAPVHVLVIPKAHVQSMAHGPDAALVGGVMTAAAAVAESLGLQKGFRLVVNTGDDGGQTVGHLHVHVLGGRQMHWPPG